MTLNISNAIFTANITLWDYNAGATFTLKVATHGNFTVGGVNAVTAGYVVCLQQPAVVARAAFDDHRTSGRGRASIGNVTLTNLFGALDVYRLYGWDGQAISIKVLETGQEYNTAASAYLDATMEAATVGQSIVRIALRDWARALEVPLQTSLYLGDNVAPDGLEGTSDLTGKPKPVCLGAPRNVSPVLVNPQKLIWQIHDDTLASVDAVYDAGLGLFGSPRVWSSIAHGLGWTKISCATTNGARILIGGTTGAAAAGLATSDDNGATWTSRTSTAAVGTEITGVAYGEPSGVATWVACSNGEEVETSAAGATWSNQLSGGDTLKRFNNVRWIDELGLFFVVGRRQRIYSSPACASGTFTSRNFNAGSSININDIALIGNYVVAGSDLGVIYRADKSVLTFTTFTVDSAAGAVWYGCHTVNGVCYVSGATGLMYTSLDGLAFTKRDTGLPLVAGLQPNIFDVGSLNGYVVGACGGGYFTLSRDNGVTWETATFSGVTDDLNCVVPAPDDRWIVGSTAGGIGRSAGAVSYANATDLEDDDLAPEPGNYGVFLDAAGSYIRLGAPPFGRVTCDPVQGASATDRTAGQLFVQVMERAGFTAGDWSATDITALDLANDAVCGFYSTDGDRTMCASVMDECARSVGAWWSTDATGVVRIAQLTTPDTNLVTEPDFLANGWAASGTLSATNQVAAYAGRIFSRITNPNGGVLRRVVTYTTNGTKRFAARVHGDAVAGWTYFLVYDDTSSVIRGEIKYTVASNGSVTAIATIGSLISIVSVGDNVYDIEGETTAVTASHTHYMYANSSGADATLTSVLMSGVRTYDALPVARLTQDADMNGMEQVPSEDANSGLPCYRAVVRYTKNYTPLAGTELAGAVTDADKAMFAAEWLDTDTDVDTAVQAAHPLASQREEESLLTLLADAQAEADRRQTLHGTERYWFDVPVFMSATTMAIELGNVVELSSTRYGMGAGTRARVLGIIPNTASNQIVLQCWV